MNLASGRPAANNIIMMVSTLLCHDGVHGAALDLPPLEELQGRHVENTRGDHGTHVEDVVAVERQVESARKPALRHPRGENQGRDEARETHHDVPRHRLDVKRRSCRDEPEVRQGDEAKAREQEEDRGPHVAVSRGLELLHEAHADGCEAKEGHGAHVQPPGPCMAVEPVVQQRDVGRHDQQRDPDVVESPHHARHVRTAAAKDVAD